MRRRCASRAARHAVAEVPGNRGCLYVLLLLEEDGELLEAGFGFGRPGGRYGQGVGTAGAG